MTRVVLCTFGSLGDLHPILALSRELTRRGMSAVVATSPAYRAKAEAAGIEFNPIGPDIKIDDPAILRRAMHPRDGTRYIFSELVMPYLRDSYHETEAVARHADLIVTHPATLGAHLYARRSGMPWASLALAPISMLSVHDMCVFPGFPARSGSHGAGPERNGYS